MKRLALILVLIVALLAAWWSVRSGSSPIGRSDRPAGQVLDSLSGVQVYHNGSMEATHGRNMVDGYNVGLKYQCVEFVKRYYLQRYDHRMPDSYGHAKDFFDPRTQDGGLNKRRGLLQFNNASAAQPQAGDLIVLDGWSGNPYGHVAIISKVGDGEVEVVQQNCGSTRDIYDLDLVDGRWRVDNKRVLGWLRMR
ncbi:MAG: CHAP domain-containing protein [Flavobacteriales bacterium]|nr:CHAP domain-containing protein [Flavobacteriales bacterium]